MTSGMPSSSQAPTTAPAPPQPRQQPSRRKIKYVPLAREVETFGGQDLKFIEAEKANLPQQQPLRDINEWGNVDTEALTMSICSRLSTELLYALTTFMLLSTMQKMWGVCPWLLRPLSHGNSTGSDPYVRFTGSWYDVDHKYKSFIIPLTCLDNSSTF
jgi:hypothetical protein